MSKVNSEEKSWIMYDWANSAYSMIITSTVLPIYFKLAAENGGVAKSTSTAIWGYTISIAALLVAILSPILGSIADYEGNKKKFFYVFFIIGIMATLALILVPENNPILLLITYAVTIVGFSGTIIFYDAFLVDVTTEERMDYISSIGYGLGYIGSTIPFVLCIGIIILTQNEVLPIGITVACKISFLITALWWGIFTIPLLKNVNQKYYLVRENKILINSFKRLFNTFKEVKRYKSIFLFLIAYFFYIDGVHTIICMATTYGTDLGISMTSLLIIFLLTQFVAFPFTIIYGKLAEKVGAKKLIYVGIITYIMICCYAVFIKTTLHFWILAMAVGSAQGGIQAISRSFFARLVPKEKSTEFFGFYSIFGKFAAILGPFLVGIVTQITGKISNGIVSLIILFVLGFIAMIKVPNVENIK